MIYVYFYTYNIMLFVTKDKFILFFPIWIAFSSFFFLNCIGQGFQYLLYWIKVAEIVIFAFFQVLKEMLSIYSNFIFCRYVIYLLLFWDIFLLYPKLFLWKDVEFFQILFHNLLKWSYSFVLILLIWCIMFIDLHLLNHACIPEMNPTW